MLCNKIRSNSRTVLISTDARGVTAGHPLSHLDGLTLLITRERPRFLDSAILASLSVRENKQRALVARRQSLYVLIVTPHTLPRHVPWPPTNNQ